MYLFNGKKAIEYCSIVENVWLDLSTAYEFKIIFVFYLILKAIYVLCLLFT